MRLYRRRAWAILATVASAVCVAPSCGSSVYTCSSDEQCGDGWCELDGHCSFEDLECSSGRRYGRHGGPEVANACVPESGDTAADDGSVGTTTSTAGESSEPSDETGTMQTSTHGRGETGDGETSTGPDETADAGTETSTGDGETSGGPFELDCTIVFEDDFEGDELDRIWNVWAPGNLGEVVQGDGVVTLGLPPASSAWVSIEHWFESFADHAIVYEIASPPSDPEAYLWVEVTGAIKYELGIAGGDTLQVRAGSVSSPPVLTSVPFDAVAHRFLRFRADGPEVEYAASPDGQSWTVLHTIEAAEDELSQAHRAAFGLGTNEELVAGAQASLDRFARCL